MLNLFLLGPLQIVQDDRALAIPRRKNRALLLYLAAHAAPLTRDQILAFFFMDHDRHAAQQILRTMLHDLRRQLDGALLVQDETLALAPGVYVDVREFQARCLRGPAEARRAALQLYRGDFLEGFTLAAVPEFDDWLARERARYRELAVRGWTELGLEHVRQKDLDLALDALNRALAFDPVNEEAQRHALRVQYWHGDRAGAIRRFEQLRAKLDEELGVPPMAETRAVYDAIVTDTLAPPGEPPKSASHRDRLHARSQASAFLPFIGRARELQVLLDAASAGKLLWIQGEPGIGKTRLLEEFLAVPANEHALVLRGSAHELEQNLPYQPVMDALRALSLRPDWQALAPSLQLPPVWWTEIAQLMPGLHTLFPTLPAPALVPDPARLWQAVHELFERLGESHPIIFLLDDVHWADAATIGMLSYLAVRASASVCFILAGRGVEPQTPLSALLRALDHDDRLTRITLDPLSPQDLQALAARLTPRHNLQLAQWLNENTDGSPFLINELVRYAYANELLTRDGAFQSSALRVPRAAPLTPTIQNLIQSRLSRLNENARRLLQTACVIGREFDFALLVRASELPEDAALDALDSLLQNGVLRPAGDMNYAFDHHLTMQFLYDGLGAARQRVLHRRIAQALIQERTSNLDAAAGLVARHFVQGGAPELAGAYALRAGDYAARLAAWAEAIAFYELALRGDLLPADRVSALLGLGTANLHQGTLPQATGILRQAFALARTLGDVARMDTILVHLGQSLIPQARFAEGIEWAREARDTGPAELALAAELTWGTCLALQGAQPQAAEQHLRAAVELLDAPRNFVSRVTAAQLDYQLAGVMGQQGRWQDAVKLYWQALARVRQDEAALDLQRHILLYNNLAYYLHLLDDPSAAEYARAGLKLARDKGSLTHQPYLLSTSGEIALAHGDLDAADRFFSEGLDLALQLGIVERRAGLTANLGLVARARGQDGRARALLTEALGYAASIDARHITTRIHLWLVPLLPREQALEHLARAKRIAADSGFSQLLEQVQELEANL